MPFRLSTAVDTSIFAPVTTTTTINNVFSQLLANAVLGAIAVPGGGSGTALNPVDPRYPAVAQPWALGAAGTGAATNQTDATLGYQGWRLRCAPAVQSLAELNSTIGVRFPLGTMLTSAAALGTVYVETSVDVQRIQVGAIDQFACLVSLWSNIPSAGGFIGLYCSSEAGANWQLAWLSGAAAYNFPFPVPQRLIDTGIPFLNNPIVLRIENGQLQHRIIINGVNVATLNAPVLIANEWTQLATAGVVQHRCAKAAGDDTLDLWVGMLTGGIRVGFVPA